jgi:hypothetical protein
VPGGGRGKGELKVLKIPSVAKGLYIGQDFGKLGKVIENAPGVIKSFGDHAIERISERGLSIEILERTVKDPLVRLSQGGGRNILYLTREAGVVLNDITGKLVTVYSKNEFKQHILDVLNYIK